MVGDLAVERYNGTGGGRVNKHWTSDRVGKANMSVCQWVYGVENYWEAKCGLNWTFETGTPKQNGMNFCPRCGKTLEQKGVADERD